MKVSRAFCCQTRAKMCWLTWHEPDGVASRLCDSSPIVGVEAAHVPVGVRFVKERSLSHQVPIGSQFGNGRS